MPGTALGVADIEVSRDKNPGPNRSYILVAR